MEHYQKLASRPGHLGLVKFGRGDLSLADFNQLLFRAMALLG